MNKVSLLNPRAAGWVGDLIYEHSHQTSDCIKDQESNNDILPSHDLQCLLDICRSQYLSCIYFHKFRIYIGHFALCVVCRTPAGQLGPEGKVLRPGA